MTPPTRPGPNPSRKPHHRWLRPGRHVSLGRRVPALALVQTRPPRPSEPPQLRSSRRRPPCSVVAAAKGLCEALPLQGRAGLRLRKSGEGLSVRRRGASSGSRAPAKALPVLLTSDPAGRKQTRLAPDAVSGNRGRLRPASPTPRSRRWRVTSPRPLGGRTGIPAAPADPVAVSVTSQPATGTCSGARRRLNKTPAGAAAAAAAAMVALIDHVIPLGSRRHRRAVRDVTAGDEDPLRRKAAAARFPKVNGGVARSRDAPRRPPTAGF
uniref:uncharacterized protein LOC143310346 n=1 Tax=Arvicanthis niloticus TaxID=61156 RepID=UPI00402BEA7F